MGKAEEKAATGLMAGLSIGRVARVASAAQYRKVRCEAGRGTSLRPVCTSIAVANEEGD